MQPGEAITISVKPFFSTAELNNQVPPGALVGILPVIRTQSGDYNPLGKLLRNNIVFAKGDYYRVLPGVELSFVIGSGSAVVGGYDFPIKPSRIRAGLRENTANQQVIINGNGACFLESPTYQKTSSEDLRALISTEPGESFLSDWTNYLEISSGGIEISFQSENKIREDYPDVIKGASANCNARTINIYLQRQSDNAIHKFGNINFLSQEIFSYIVNDWNNGVNATIPAVSSCSLFSPRKPIAREEIGDLASDSYRAAISYQYTGSQVTAISHASPPCIEEWYGDFTPASVEIGEVAIGYPAEVVNSGTSNNAIFDFRIPPGLIGASSDGGRFRGEYSEIQFYNEGDLVLYEGDLVALETNITPLVFTGLNPEGDGFKLIQFTTPIDTNFKISYIPSTYSKSCEVIVKLSDINPFNPDADIYSYSKYIGEYIQVSPIPQNTFIAIADAGNESLVLKIIGSVLYLIS
ncbi:MAG: hypothetical protein HC836_38825 [Richelia sp. RM2_1_2]|nr:hypothetical protein [Richelia sp. RM2_1_2]